MLNKCGLLEINTTLEASKYSDYSFEKI